MIVLHMRNVAMIPLLMGGCRIGDYRWKVISITPGWLVEDANSSCTIYIYCMHKLMNKLITRLSLVSLPVPAR